MNAVKEKVSGWWSGVPASAKRMYLISGVLVLVLIVPAFMPNRGGDAPPTHGPAPDENIKETSMVAPPVSQATEVDLSAEVSALQGQLNKNEIAQTTEAKAVLEETKRLKAQTEITTELEKTGLAAQIKELKEEMQLMKSGVGRGPSVPLPDLPTDPIVSSVIDPALPSVNTDPNAYNGQAALPVAAPERKKIRVVSSQGDVSDADLQKDAEKSKVKKAHPDEDFKITMTSGAIIEGVLLNGMDAPAGSIAEKNPVPALFRVKKDAVLPNRFSSKISECFIIVSGYGSLSTERAVLRSERMSCILKGGGAVETKLDGYVVGMDGRTGIRGRLVSREGQLIAKSLLAGTIGGVGTALSAYSTPQVQVTDGSSSSSINFSKVGPQALTTGLATGLNTAAQEVAQFYLELARATVPTVEIDAGSRATIVLLKGTTLNFSNVEGTQ